MVFAESLPYPPLKGGDHRTWQNVHALAQCARVGVLGLCSNDMRRHTAPDIPLEFWRTSDDPTLTVPPPQGVRLAARAWLLNENGHPSDIFYSERAAAELAGWLEEFQPDVVIVEGVWLHGYLDAVRSGGRRVILDCHNVEAEISRQLAAKTPGNDLESRVRRNVLPARTEALERNAIAAVEEIWVCSSEDERRMKALYEPAASVAVVPNSVNVADYDEVAATRGDDGTLTLVFPGFFGHAPNVHAGLFLIEQVLPRLVRATEDWRLILVGALPSEGMIAAAACDERITVTGAVRDIRPWLGRATLMPVPLFEGSGTRLKILEAFAAGVPVISTTRGAEGLDVTSGTHLLYAQSADEFVSAALAVWKNPSLRERLIAGASALVRERYSWDVVGACIRQNVCAAARA